MRRKIAAVELHTFDELYRCLEALALFNCDNAVFADPLEGFRHNLADFHVVVGGYRSDIDDILCFGNVDWLYQ